MRKISIKRILVPLSLIVLICSSSMTELTGKVTSKLPGSAMESEGVSSSGIIDFLNAVDTASRVELHSFMFLRHNKATGFMMREPAGPSPVQLRGVLVDIK